MKNYSSTAEENKVLTICSFSLMFINLLFKFKESFSEISYSQNYESSHIKVEVKLVSSCVFGSGDFELWCNLRHLSTNF